MYNYILNFSLLISKFKCLERRLFNDVFRSISTSKSIFCKMDDTGLNPLFQGVEDRFHGITVDSKEEVKRIEEFSSKLEESIKSWTANKKRGIWFKVALEHAELVPILAKKGFNFHHANSGYVMMYYWLPDETCNIPPYAHTMLAVGAIVVNDRSEILVVREKYFQIGHWKFPGGLVEPGENLVISAIREVKEETNIDSEFISLISLRHAHKTMFDCSDMYVVIALKALSDRIKKCDREILECRWMRVDDFLNHDEVTEMNKLFVQRFLEYQKNNIKFECKEGVHYILKKEYCVYSIVKDNL